MKASRFMGLLFTFAAVIPVANAEENPFIPADPGGSIGQIERRLNDLEIRIQQSEMRSEEEMLNSQYPGVAMNPGETGNDDKKLKAGDVVIGKINGDCLIKRTDHAERVRVMALPSVTECVTPEPANNEPNQTDPQSR
jgi:hypothetical protein